MHRACIALGSNLGHRAATLAAAGAALASLPGVRMLALSRSHETAPVGPPGQRPYLNAAAVVETELSPHALLDALLEIERRFGRDRGTSGPRWGPRTLDLDLLFYDDVVLDTPGLTLPHPRMHERLFVIAPLAEIAPDAVHPLCRLSVAELLRVQRAEAQ